MEGKRTTLLTVWARQNCELSFSHKNNDKKNNNNISEHQIFSHSAPSSLSYLWAAVAQEEGCWFDSQLFLAKCRGVPEQET